MDLCPHLRGFHPRPQCLGFHQSKSRMNATPRNSRDLERSWFQIISLVCLQSVRPIPQVSSGFRQFRGPDLEFLWEFRNLSVQSPEPRDLGNSLVQVVDFLGNLAIYEQGPVTFRPVQLTDPFPWESHNWDTQSIPPKHKPHTNIDFRRTQRGAHGPPRALSSILHSTEQGPN